MSKWSSACEISSVYSFITRRIVFTVIQFRDCLVLVAKALDAVANWKELQSAAKARTLRVAVGDGEFVMAIVCLSDLLAHTLPLSRLYQKECVDQAVALADELETELRLPRITKRQSYRSNTPALDPESFYRTP
ncbi:hypothetical protein HPB52_005789 [Rhipicephalus sanguineus]|uniref:Uncharacterized protein n=1 Tax=Rhipicephalus sanguineus TaxID=34632 RepID=A0A9D4PUK8_RHISA|nr:hypothetical protein HPB52_005789 [Rhipicephalus sanguineus]